MRQKVENSILDESVSAAERELIEALLKYPSLEKIFDPADERQFQTMRGKLRATADDLEGVVRHSTKEDAAQAAQAIEAIQLTIKFLDDLDARRRL
ncbi:MAG: hypothetical protein M3T96_02005 [Acidobacteriota bacterium]|nr:hypothetical protein [Acidobacteriota bacterium]